MCSSVRPAARAAAFALLAAAATARADPGTFDIDMGRESIATAGSFALAAVLAIPALAPSRCRFCAPDSLDAAATRALAWRNPAPARLASDLIANVAIPVGAATNALASAALAGHARWAAADALAIAEAAALALDLNQLAKDSVARIRPSAFQAGAIGGGEASRSFYSGHTSFAFSIATASATVSTIRGYPDAPWIWGFGLTLAAGVGYLRVAADAHWLTDVVAGAVMGGGVGFAVPWLLHRPRERRNRIEMVPAPGGIALLF